MSALTYSIIIPAYNESQRISASLDRILTYIEEQKWTAEVIVVNDGSRDNTSQIVQEYARRHPEVRLIENPGNKGKGYTVRNGIMHSRGDVVLFTDADLSSPIEESRKLFEALRSGADIAFGSRWLQAELQKERQPFYRQVFGRIFNLLLRIILGLKYKDTQCGFKAFTHDAAMSVFTRQKVDRWGFDPEILYLANKSGMQVREVPVEWAHDNRSKINPVTDGMKMFAEMLRIRWSDLTGKYDKSEAALAVTKTA